MQVDTQISPQQVTSTRIYIHVLWHTNLLACQYIYIYTHTDESTHQCTFITIDTLCYNTHNCTQYSFTAPYYNIQFIYINSYTYISIIEMRVVYSLFIVSVISMHCVNAQLPPGGMQYT